jgi:hypothetical protein
MDGYTYLCEILSGQPLMLKADLDVITPARYSTELWKWSFKYDGYINHCLRQAVIPQHAFNMISTIFKAVNESKSIDYDYVCFRGLNSRYDPEKSRNSFTSKSFSLEEALAFTGGDENNEGTLLIIKYPAGSKQLFVDVASKFETFDECEILSFPGEIFHEVGFVKFQPGPNLYFLEYVGNNFQMPLVDPSIDERINNFIGQVLLLAKNGVIWINQHDLYTVGTRFGIYHCVYPNIEVFMLYDFLFTKFYSGEIFNITVAKQKAKVFEVIEGIRQNQVNPELIQAFNFREM